MKNFTSTIFTLLLVLLTTAAFATNDDGAKVYEGYVVLANGEKLEGKIEMMSPTLNEVKVKFIAANGSKTIYKAKEVDSYAFIFPVYNAETKSYNNEWITYVKKDVEQAPIPFGPTNVLIERQATGTVNLYNHYIETRTAAHAFEHIYYVEKDGQMIAVNRTNFKEVLKEMFADHAELQAQIGKPGYGYKYVAKIISEYNEYVNNGTRIADLN